MCTHKSAYLTRKTTGYRYTQSTKAQSLKLFSISLFRVYVLMKIVTNPVASRYKTVDDLLLCHRPAKVPLRTVPRVRGPCVRLSLASRLVPRLWTETVVTKTERQNVTLNSQSPRIHHQQVFLRAQLHTHIGTNFRETLNERALPR